MSAPTRDPDERAETAVGVLAVRRIDLPTRLRLEYVEHGDPTGAALMNPFGLILFPLAVGLALMTFAPQGWRATVAGWAEQRAHALNVGAILFGAALGLYGLARIVWLLWSAAVSWLVLS